MSANFLETTHLGRHNSIKTAVKTMINLPSSTPNEDENKKHDNNDECEQTAN